MVTEKIKNYIQSINASNDKIIKTAEESSEETIRWKPSEEEWSILQVLSHVAEATPFWLGEVEHVLENPGSEWGRGLQHPGRLAAVENPDALDVEKVIADVKNLKTQVSERLSKIDESRLTEENPHRNFERFGNKPVSFIIEHFIDEHTAGHYDQIQRNLRKLSNSNK